MRGGSNIGLENYNLFKQTYKNFRWNVKAVIVFEIIYKLLAVFIVIPLNYFILDRYMQQAGVNHVTNTNLFRFALTPQGMMSILCILVISFIAIFIEMAVLIYMADKAHKQQSVSLLEGIINCIRIIPKRLSLYHIAMVLMTGVIGPLTGLGLYNSMIRKLSVPSFIQLALFKSWQGKVFFTIVMLGLCILLVRWILAIPIIIIEETTLKEAFKKSISIYKENKYKLIMHVVVWAIITGLLEGGLLVVYMGVGTIIISMLAPFGVVGKMFVGLYLIVYLIGKTVISVMALPLFITFLVEIYYKYRNDRGKERVFKSISVYEETKLYQWIGCYKQTAIQIILTIFASMVGIMAMVTMSDSVINKRIAVTAHRGSSSKAPENTLSAIKLAMSEKADYIEIDVMLTKDQEVVLSHDANLKRVSGHDQMIKEMTLEEVKKIDIGSYFDSEYSQERIPTLKEVLELIKGKTKLNIELKPMENGKELAEKVAEVLEAYDMHQDVVVSSLDYECLQVFRARSPLTKIGYILSLGVGDFTKLDVDFVSVEYDLLTKGLSYAMSGCGKEIHVWTINDPEKVRDVARLRVDNIITDSVEMVQEKLDELEYTKDIDSLAWFYRSIFIFNRYLEI